MSGIPHGLKLYQFEPKKKVRKQEKKTKEAKRGFQVAPVKIVI